MSSIRQRSSPSVRKRRPGIVNIKVNAPRDLNVFAAVKKMQAVMMPTVGQMTKAGMIEGLVWRMIFSSIGESPRRDVTVLTNV